MIKIFENPVAQNRTEELGYDLWEDFVIPPYYNSLDLLTARKPRVIIGGRGCGKTMLLRYLCHETQFSLKRKHVDISELTRIGLYWRIDTQFAKMLTNRGGSEEDWLVAFEHMAILLMSREVLKSLDSIANCCFNEFTEANLSEIDFSVLKSFNSKCPNNYLDLKKFLRQEFNYFQAWAGNINKLDQPIFLVKGFLIELITIIKEQCDIFTDTNYFVYIDEYENLLPNQQKLINTWVKHSEMPLIFNLAMKRYSFKERNTIGNEQLVETHDYRHYDLESYYNDNVDYNVFAAEILFLRLYKSGIKNIPISPEDLRSADTNIINKRKEKEYKEIVTHYAKGFLPSIQQSEIAKEILRDDRLRNRLVTSIQEAIDKRKLQLSATSFILDDFPQASVIIPALLNRDTDINLILLEIKKLRDGKENSFSGKTNWIQNNFIGCVLLLYEPLGRYCPFYSGFDAFCQMSSKNLRHFLELCNKSIINENLSITDSQTSLQISVKHQAEAAKQASVGFLKEVKSFGTKGNLLYRFVLRLGTYFHWAHKRPSQSEPELNHFSVKGHSENIVDFLQECVKWSVLYEYPITKLKSGNKNLREEYFEYMLNPIYAPYFHISYRKKRRIDFPEDDIKTIMFGEVLKYEELLNTAIKKWSIDDKNDSTLTLFPHQDL